MIKTYLPQPLSDVEIDQIIDESIQATGATGMQQMGEVMALVKPRVQGRAEMGQVSARVKARL